MLEKNPEISVIVPVYNVEKWLPKCLDSILGQTYGDFELILVNDGSTDGSLKICREYEVKDKRLRVINGPNRGSSAARNTGLEFAQGKWIIFCDSDDWWDLQLLEKLHTAAIENDADIAVCGAVWEYENYNEVTLYPNDKFEPRSIIPLIGGIYSCLWNKLVRRSLYSKYDIKGENGITMWDDHLITSRLRYHSRRTVIVNEGLYHYNKCVENSICQTKGNIYPSSQIQVVNYLSRYYKQYSHGDEKLVRAIISYAQLEIFRWVDYDEWHKIFKDPVFSMGAIKLYPGKKQKLVYMMALLLPNKLYKQLMVFYKSVKD